jgi:hypothetical protein
MKLKDSRRALGAFRYLGIILVQRLMVEIRFPAADIGEL